MPKSPPDTLDWMCTASRGRPESLRALPTASSLRYICAVSISRYPALSAVATAATASGPVIGYVPNPV